MKEWIRTASATFAGGAVAIGLVAIPTYVWLPREFDEIRQVSELAAGEATLAKSASLESRDKSTEVLSKIDGLVVAIASMDAEPVNSNAIVMTSNGLVVRGGNSGIDIQFTQLLPQDVLREIVEAGKLSRFRYTSFNGDEWVFIDRASFNEFTFERQRELETSFERSDVSFIVD